MDVTKAIAMAEARIVESGRSPADCDPAAIMLLARDIWESFTVGGAR